MKNVNVQEFVKALEKEWQKKSGLKGLILQKWKIFIKEDKKRISGGMIFSIILHLIFIGGYFSLADLDKPEEPPIREINFIDMTEEVPKPKPPKRVKPRVQPEYAESSSERAKESPSAKTHRQLPAGSDRIFLDRSRKQVPINLDKAEAVASPIGKPNDLIKISPAKGLRSDAKIARPSPINLSGDKKLLLASNSTSQGGIAFAPGKKPEIRLDGSAKDVSTTSGSISLESAPPAENLAKANVKTRQTETFISGPLASRKIIKKIIPPFPAWAKRKGVGASIALRFTVMENGEIRENIIVEQTSGSGDWDRMVINALKQWQFAALKKSGLRLDQSGVITFKFVI
jgi:TonB family protein